VVAAVGLLLASACSKPQAEVSTKRKAVTEGTTYPGYTHVLAKSKFAMGSVVTNRSEFGIQKSIGETGVFGTVEQTGWVLATPNADSPSRSVAALSTSPDVHNTAVKNYFTAAGLPADQIGSVNAHATVHSTTGPDDPPGPTPMVFDWYSSVISRAINGVPIADSFAWAIINKNNDVVEEQVYWPAVAASVVAEAQLLKAKLADPMSGPTYLRALPKSFSPGQVVVHHTPCVGGTAEAKATYDVYDKGDVGMARPRHFGISGAEIVLAAESVPVAPNTTKR